MRQHGHQEREHDQAIHAVLVRMNPMPCFMLARIDSLDLRGNESDVDHVAAK